MKTAHRFARRSALPIVALLLLPSSALAHLVTTGIGPVYDGIAHLLLTPQDLIPVLALSLYAGQLGPASGRRALFFLPVAWLTGGLAGLWLSHGPKFPVEALSFLLLGGLIATNVRVSTRILTTAIILVGLLHGLVNGVALREGPGAPGLLGIAAALFALVAITAGFFVVLRRPWQLIAIRVAGSWVVAIGVLMVGWSMGVQG